MAAKGREGTERCILTLSNMNPRCLVQGSVFVICHSILYLKILCKDGTGG